MGVFLSCALVVVFLFPTSPCESLHYMSLDKHSCICNRLVEHLDEVVFEEVYSSACSSSGWSQLTRYWIEGFRATSLQQRQAPVHATPFLVFLNTFCTLKSSEICIRFIGIAWNPLMHCFPWYPYLYRYFCEVSKLWFTKMLSLA
jgi:hypothetical protein